MPQKQVKIVGLSINENFGSLKATKLTFDKDNRLTIIKGEVGSGKTTLNRAMRLTTQGSGTLEDKGLYGDIDVVTQLSDGGKSIFVGCKTDKKGSLTYFLYTLDENGKKINDVIIDGVKATPATYLKSLQTALTWRLDELTSENATTQRNILLELYRQELEAKDVIFDKANPAYVGSIIDKIEKAKNHRSLMDMKRKEVGGIADDMTKKGIDYSNVRKLKPTLEVEQEIRGIEAKISLALMNIEQTKTNSLNELKVNGSDVTTKLRNYNDVIVKANKVVTDAKVKYDNHVIEFDGNITNIETSLKKLGMISNAISETLGSISSMVTNPVKPQEVKTKQLNFNEKGQCLSVPGDFEHDKVLQDLLEQKAVIGVKYMTLLNSEKTVVDTSKMDTEVLGLKETLQGINEYNKEAKAVNAFYDWQAANDDVNDIKKDYFMKLTGINTGVDGLHIAPEYVINDKGEKVAKDNNIYLMYDGSYDPDYFSNPNKELRKLSSYSGTQKPMICLLIQNYLLGKKNKVLPYLWIDNIPIDKKTRNLLDKMSSELGLWLFVNWTGDFSAKTLENGEILLENGEVLQKSEN